MEELGFPAWIRATHFLNIIFMSFLIRSGIEILAAHPKLYWNDDCRHGSEWARFTKKEMPKDELLEEIGIPLTPVRLKCALLGLGVLKVALNRAKGTPLPDEWAGLDELELK